MGEKFDEFLVSEGGHMLTLFMFIVGHRGSRISSKIVKRSETLCFGGYLSKKKTLNKESSHVAKFYELGGKVPM